MKIEELYNLLLAEVQTMNNSFNVVNLTKKILGLNKISQNDIADINKRNSIINVNKTIYMLMVLHTDINKIHIDLNQPVLNGRSFGDNRGVTYTISTDSLLDETILKILYLYVTNIIELRGPCS